MSNDYAILVPVSSGCCYHFNVRYGTYTCYTYVCKVTKPYIKPASYYSRQGEIDGGEIKIFTHRQ